MTDLNISSFSAEVQKYIADNKIDANNDGKIDGKELQTLLTGGVENSNEISDSAKFSGPRKIISVYDMISGLENAVNKYNNSTQEYRQTIVDNTKNAMNAKLETLDNLIKKSYDDVRESMSTFSYAKVDLGGRDSLVGQLAETFRNKMKEVEVLFEIAQYTLNHAIDGYRYNQVPKEKVEAIDVEREVLSRLGYSSIEDFAKAFAEDIQNYDPSQGTTTQEKLELIAKRTEKVNAFMYALNDTFKPEIEKSENTYQDYVQRFRTSFEQSEKILDETVENGLSNPVETLKSLDYPTAITFTQELSKKYMDDIVSGIESAKVEVDGKEYEVGKKYQEQGPDGKPRIYTYDRLGNKWDIRGFKLND